MREPINKHITILITQSKESELKKLRKLMRNNGLKVIKRKNVPYDIINSINCALVWCVDSKKFIYDYIPHVGENEITLPEDWDKLKELLFGKDYLIKEKTIKIAQEEIRKSIKEVSKYLDYYLIEREKNLKLEKEHIAEIEKRQLIEENETLKKQLELIKAQFEKL